MGRSSISVRGLAAIAALGAFLCLGAADASAAPLIWASNFGEDTVTTVDGATGRAIGSPIKVGDEPESIAITPDGRRAVVSGVGTATVIETATRLPVKTFELESAGGTVAISPDGQRAYVASSGSGEVTVIDPETAKLVGSFTVGSQPARAVAFSPDGASAYVSVGPEELVVVDTATEEVVGKPIPVGGFATSIVFTPDGESAYVTGNAIGEVKVIDTALGEVVKSIPLPVGTNPHSLAMSPDGKDVYLGSTSPGSLRTIETARDRIVGEPIELATGPNELALAPDGKTVFVAGGKVAPINLLTEKEGAPIAAAGSDVLGLAIAPDQSPRAAFTAPPATAGAPVTFSGAASSDPDGTIALYSWGFGDGSTATGASATHTYKAAGTYSAKLSVVDNEGCGEEMVFTGRTAYCSGSAPAVHPVAVVAPTVPPIVPAVPSNNFTIRRIVHNRSNGTVRVQVRLPSAGFVLLFGHKVHAVTRKSRGVQSMWLTLHARVELAKRLKKTLHAPVRFRITFTPNGGLAKTVHRTVTLQRRPHHKHGKR
jgi:YVTN family beta-propeller protein